MKQLPTQILVEIAGAGYGMLELMIEPWIVHPAQVLLDYPLAFGALGLAGIFHATWHRGVIDGQTKEAIWLAVLPAVVVATSAIVLPAFAKHTLTHSDNWSSA